ncbi:MAG: type IV pilus twitching motility protein PilT [bacterium]|jgi:twitching motility protein PilT|nr:type IV pilus twitching motility protein PilT [bacterium]
MDANEWMREFLDSSQEEAEGKPKEIMQEEPQKAIIPEVAPQEPPREFIPEVAPPERIQLPPQSAPLQEAPQNDLPEVFMPPTRTASEPVRMDTEVNKAAGIVKISCSDTSGYSMDDLLTALVNSEGSDLHLNINVPPIFRIDGCLLKTTLPDLAPEDNQRLVYGILSKQQRQTLEEHRQIDIAYSVADVGRFRVNCFYTRRGLCSVLRAIPLEIKTIEELGMASVLKGVFEHPNGLVLVTGPTGSGKTTTLAAIVHYLNMTKSHHIITIEDPVEFEHKSINSLISQRQVGVDTESFASALKAALREDPDIILVGELRDIETIRLAITASETGHLVLGTLHTNNATKTVERIIDIFPQEQQNQVRMQLADSIRAIIAQRLVPMASGEGRVAALEILVGVHAVKNLIRERKTHQLYSIISTQRDLGMVTLDQYLIDLYKDEKITLQSAMDLFEYPKEAVMKMQKLGLQVE